MRNRPLRREAKPPAKKKAARHSRDVAASGATASSAAPKVEVTPEECGRLAEDLAYFNVCLFREAPPGELRKDDIERAEKDIIAVTGRTP